MPQFWPWVTISSDLPQCETSPSRPSSSKWGESKTEADHMCYMCYVQWFWRRLSSSISPPCMGILAAAPIRKEKSVAADLNPSFTKIFSFVPLFFAALSLLIIRTLKPAPNHEPLLSHWALLINDLKDPALHHTGCGGSNPFICFSRSSNSFALKSHLMGFNPSYFKIMGGVKSFNPISR